MAELILLRGAKQLLTLRGPSGVRRGAAHHDLSIIEDGSVLIQDGLIVAVGPTRRIENLKQTRDAIEISLDGKILMPGFIDPAINVSVDTNIASQSGKRKALSEFHEANLALMRSCLQHGTLIAEIKASNDGSDFRDDVPVFRQLARIAQSPVQLIRTWRLDRLPSEDGDSLNHFYEALSTLAKRRLVQFVQVALDSEQTIDETLLASIEEKGLGIKVFWSGGSEERLLDLISRFRPGSVCCPDCMGEVECAALCQLPSIVVFAPAKQGFDGPAANCPRKVIDAGGRIALATHYDSRHPASSSMQMAISLAVMRMKLTVEEAIVGATINAAHAVGCGDVSGTIEFQKRADLVVLSVPDYRELSRQFGINHVEMVMRNGQVVFNRGSWKADAR